jgi:predicted alpha/beta superfamily hydrolase
MKRSEMKKEAFPHVIIENSELRPFHSKAVERDYLLYIAYPESYAGHPERKYPVVYLTDAYWNFIKMQSLGPSLWFDRIVPEYIVVGIGYAGAEVDCGKERMYELSPTPQTSGYMTGFEGRMGGSRVFLDAMKQEIIPYVEKNLHVDPTLRVLAGFSMGGLFCLYSMFEEPDLFQGVIASSPSVEWDRRWIFKRADECRVKAGDDKSSLPTRLFLSVGDSEWPHLVGAVKDFDACLAKAGYADFDYRFRVFEDCRHSGATVEAYNSGLRFVFLPRRPSASMP